ncbi:hypothetical protein BH09MYX1_BH09MYX1_13550 [soil metagenome]
MDDSLKLEAKLARNAITRGALRGDPLLALLLDVPMVERDPWVDALLGLKDAPPDIPELPRGAVPYLPCGVDEILALVRDVPVRAEDHVVDVGSGLGRVAILVHLLTGARTSGVEIQAPLVLRARERCADLGLDAIAFVEGNAVDAPLDGSIFFLYAPFNGDTLRRVIERLEDVARRRSIVVCTVALELRDAGWLVPRSTSSLALTIYDSR